MSAAGEGRQAGHELCGARLVLDPSGALAWPEEGVLVVSDLHFETGSSFARRGFFVPPYDTGVTLAKLEAVMARHRPARVVCLGDSFHDAGGSARLSSEARARLVALAEAAEWTWISGNHDPAPPEGLPGTAADVVSIGPLTFRHEPTAGPAPGEVAGHLHPAASVALPGRWVRRKAFVADATRMVMPAFGAYTGGLDVFHRAFAPLFRKRDFAAFLLGTGLVHRFEARLLAA